MSDKELTKPTPSLQAYLRSESVQQRIESLLEKRAPQFTATLMSVVNSNLLLQKCEPPTVLTAAITAAGLDLPIDNNLSFAFIIPYRDGKTGTYKAQFQIGYKGFIQLAQRSGYYRTINATDVREGELLSENKLSGELEFEWVKDETERNKLPVIGYVAYFKLNNGFEKSSFMSVESLKAHAKKYSQSYKKGYGLWVDNFDKMATKTVLKLLISTYGPMSTQMQEAILADQAAVEEDNFKYIDNEKPDNSPIQVDSTLDETQEQPPEQEDVSQETIETNNEEKSSETIGGMRRSKLFAVLKDRGFTGDAAKHAVYGLTGVTSINDITVGDFDDVLKMIENSSIEELREASEINVSK